MSLYQRGKSVWYYDFIYKGQRYTGCLGKCHGR